MKGEVKKYLVHDFVDAVQYINSEKNVKIIIDFLTGKISNLGSVYVEDKEDIESSLIVEINNSRYKVNIGEYVVYDLSKKVRIEKEKFFSDFYIGRATKDLYYIP